MLAWRIKQTNRPKYSSLGWLRPTKKVAAARYLLPGI